MAAIHVETGAGRRRRGEKEEEGEGGGGRKKGEEGRDGGFICAGACGRYSPI